MSTEQNTVDSEEQEIQNAYRSELTERAELIRDWAKQRNLSDRQLERKFPGIGSAATLSRILSQDWERVKVDRQLPNYRAVCLLLEDYAKAEKRNEKVIDSLSRVIRVEAAIKQAMLNDDNTRLVMVQGPSASGKTTSTQLACSKLKGYEVVNTEADESWRESPMAMAMAIITGLSGVSIKRNEGSQGKVTHVSARTALDEVYERISNRSMVLVIDQADMLGPKTLNTCTSVLNKCPRLVLVLVCLETLWNLLMTRHFETCRQLTENRLSARVVFQAANETDPDWVADATAILKDRIQWEKPDLADRAAKMIAKEAGMRGNLKFLTLAIRQARNLNLEKPVSLEDFALAITKVRAAR
jgi:hypothetical protein